MNRIIRYLREKGKARQIEKLFQSGESLLAFPKDLDLDRCSFCNKSIANQPFRAWSHPATQNASVICHDCIKTLSVFAKFTDHHLLWFQEPVDYSPLRKKLLRRLSVEDGQATLKAVVVDVAIRFLQRSSAILSGGEDIDKCDWVQDSRTGVPLATPRIAIVGPPKITSDLMQIACEEIGIVCAKFPANEVESGKAYNAIAERLALHAPGWAEYALLLSEKYIQAHASCGVVFTVENADGLPMEMDIYRM